MKSSPPLTGSSLPTNLRIADSLALPLSTVTDTIGILAVKGAGKSYTFMLLVEEMVRAKLPVIVIDIVGVCWGLRLAADGKRPGLDVIILGGQHGDLPLKEDSGELLANWVLDNRRPVILDFTEFPTKASVIRFALDFLTELYQKARREPLHVILDEADELAPQKPFGEDRRLLHAVEILVRRGRARGIGVTMVTQRPAVLSKNILTQIGTLIVGRTSSPQDRKAIEAWIDAHATPSQRTKFLISLASLPTREKWVWCPTRDVFSKIIVRQRKTFDSSSTPKIDELVVKPSALPPGQLRALRRSIYPDDPSDHRDPKLKTKTKKIDTLTTQTPDLANLLEEGREVLRKIIKHLKRQG